MGSAEEPAPGADPLEPIRRPIQEAGSQLAAALRACAELPADCPDAEDIHGWLIEAARLIGRAEVRSYPVRQGFGPPDWKQRRDQWEFAHAASAVVHALGLGSLIAATLADSPADP
jgi:hypothetical protein